jgi:ABC-type branched-subunit amino acid transport system substrate-binding protein
VDIGKRRSRALRRGAALAVLIAALVGWAATIPASAQAPPLKIAVQSSLTGNSALAGNAFVEAIRYAVDEANAGARGVHVEMQVFDDGSTEEGSRSAARAVIGSDAAVVLGPARTPLAISACHLYGEAGLPVIATTLHADELTANPTTFRTVISTGEIGETLGDYLGRILHRSRAVVFSVDNGYGRPLADRFRASAERQSMEVRYLTFNTAAERDRIAHALGTEPDPPPIILGMEYEDAVPALIALRRAGYRGLVMGTATMARATFITSFAKEPEERDEPGFFTDETYATSPMILDSANAEILAFAARFEAATGHEPSWETVQAYDGATLAMAAMSNALARQPDLATSDVNVRRAAILAAIKGYDAPTRAILGLNGPIWFTPDRVRRQAVRIGRFYRGVFESAPLQLVPVAAPDPGELESGAVFETEPARFYRLQRVVQTGTFLNLLPRVDVAKSSFAADFYLWLRYSRDGGPGAADPVDIGFPGMLSGRFNSSAPAEATEMDDGTDYRLWRIQGEFRADFDLHRFPFDRQDLPLRFFNTRASSDRIVYVLDRRSPPGAPSPDAGRQDDGIGGAAAAASPSAKRPQASHALASPTAFDDLSQWRPVGAGERRDTLVTPSALGDLRRIGLETPRELSGFVVSFELQRRTMAVLVKMLLPMLLMTIVMYTTLHFPVALTKEKVTVVVTAALSGAVFLSAVNNQLGSVGYTIMAEYAFYAFFALGLLCMLYVTIFEALRLNGRTATAERLQHITRIVFLIVVVSTVALASVVYGIVET